MSDLHAVTHGSTVCQPRCAAIPLQSVGASPRASAAAEVAVPSVSIPRGRGTVGAWLLTGHCTRRISRRAGHVGPDGVGLQIRLFLTLCPSARCFPNFFTVAVCRFRLRFGGAALALPSNWGILVLQRVHPTRTGTAARKRANYQRC